MLGISVRPSHADIILAPDQPGVSFNGIPFWPGLGEARYHQIYDSSLFKTPLVVDSIAMSPGSEGSLSGNISIGLGVTNVDAANISEQLDDNLTSPLTTVYSNEEFNVEMPAVGHDSFSIEFDTNPFRFDPRQGNLLVEIRAVDMSGDSWSMSRAPASDSYGRAWITRGSGSLASGTGNTVIRLQMSVTSIPEPSSLLLVAMVFLAIVSCCKSRQTKA